MTPVAATLAGGSNNQDRYVIGQTFAAVLDGATSVAGDRSHDPGWFAEQIGSALAQGLAAGAPIIDAVAEAIDHTRRRHALTPDRSPSSTLAIARWTHDAVETYVLGDSPAVVLWRDGTETVYEDPRLDEVAPAQRAAYRTRLTAGYGYDDTHRAVLVELQQEQARSRNQHGGYWIVGTDPTAAEHGFISTTQRTDVQAVLLASDGVALDRHPTATRWRDIHHEATAQSPEQVLRHVHDAEATDPDGSRWPRAKRHDDKTLVVIDPSEFRETEQ